MKKYGHKFNDGEVYNVKNGESLDTVADNRGKTTGENSGAYAYGLGYDVVSYGRSATIQGSLIQARSLGPGAARLRVSNRRQRPMLMDLVCAQAAL